MIRNLLKTESLAWPLILCLVAAFVCVFTYNTADPDLWGHVRYGDDMLRQGRIFDTDPYSYLSDGFPWVNHELLCEFTLGYLEPRFGVAGLFGWKLLMGAVLVGALVWTHRGSRYEPLTIVTVGSLLALSLWPGWTFRPQIFTYTFLSLLALLSTEHGRGRRHVLWFAPPLMIAWTNAHGGFVAGLGVLAVYVIFAIIKNEARREAGWFANCVELVVVMLATCAATLVNPYGTGLLTWLWDSLTYPRPEISEWWSVRLFSRDYFAFKLFVALSAVVLITSRRPQQWVHLAILSMAALQAFLHCRHIPLFAILAAYRLPEHLDDCVQRLRTWLNRRAALPGPDAGSVRMYRAALFALTVLFTGLSVAQVRAIEVERAAFPVSAFEFIERHQLSGRMVTEFNWGQYCLYSFSPRILVSVDGRFDTSYSREVLDVNLDFMMGDHPRFRNRSPQTGPFQADRVLDLNQPNLALIDRQRTKCVEAIERRPDWLLLYQDALAQVWGRREVYDDPKSSEYLPPSERLISNETQAGTVAYPALPAAAARAR